MSKGFTIYSLNKKTHFASRASFVSIIFFPGMTEAIFLMRDISNIHKFDLYLLMARMFADFINPLFKFRGIFIF